jgi:hypothetical protein
MEQLSQELKEKVIVIAKDYLAIKNERPFGEFEESIYLQGKYDEIKKDFYEFSEFEGDFFVVLNDCIKEILGRNVV